MSTIWLSTTDRDLTGEENMARDRGMAEACRIDQIPRLRFYTWQPWTLSLGYNQDEERIDHDAIRRAGYDLVRRPTGGRAVFHAEELTYSVAMPAGGEGIHRTYARISSALRRGFELLGAEGIEFSRSAPDFREHYGDVDSEGCFSASALNELTFKGRKLVGSAQRRFGSILLQHGSILTGEAHLGIVDLLAIRPELRQGMRERLRRKSATLAEILDPLPGLDELAEALGRGFEIEFDCQRRPTGTIDTPVEEVNSPERTVTEEE